MKEGHITENGRQTYKFLSKTGDFPTESTSQICHKSINRSQRGPAAGRLLTGAAPAGASTGESSLTLSHHAPPTVFAQVRSLFLA